MGNSPSTARQVIPVDSNDQSFWDSSPILQQFRVEAQFPAGSGRMMKTFRLKHSKQQSTCVAKAMYVPASLDLTEQQDEIERLKSKLAKLPHVAVWTLLVGNSTRIQNLMYKPVALLRPHMYTTLRDRLASRPFLDPVEQIWITTQLLQALDQLHSAGVVHGFVSSSNIGLTSSGWVVLLDCSSVYKPFVNLPDDDPADYLLGFHSERCYLAPERFCKASLTARDIGDQGQGVHKTTTCLTPAMDIFATGCVVVELFLNGERCMDLGDLMEYRRGNFASVQQKLAKIEHAAIRAACRHMLNLDPQERLSAKEYLERLEAQEETVPRSLKLLTDFVERTTLSLTPDARIALAAQEYGQIIWECMGVPDTIGKKRCYSMLGPDLMDTSEKADDLDLSVSPKTVVTTNELFAEADELLKLLEAFDLEEDVLFSSKTVPAAKKVDTSAVVERVATLTSTQSLIIYLQLILSNVRHVQRPATKLVALQLLRHLVQYFSDDTRLQRFVPVMVAMVNDQDHLVRASVIDVLTYTLSLLESFSPSDSKLFPQYIFKRVSHLISDPSAIVRIAFARSIGRLAESSLRFLDISHAVRLYEAVGSGSGLLTPSEDASQRETVTVFADDVAKLLDTPGGLAHPDGSVASGRSESASVAAGSVLISGSYAAELAGLHETVSRWVVHVTTDQADDSVQAKLALLKDIGRLCAFFGLEGVMSFILPQILAFLNDRKNWVLRLALFEALPSVCRVMGRGATEEFVLPCVEIGLVDMEELVIEHSLSCLRRLLDLGLLSRWAIVGSERMPSLLERYGALLLHPSTRIRNEAIQTCSTACLAIGARESEVYLLPILRSCFRFRPPAAKLFSAVGLSSCLLDPWTREQFTAALRRISSQIQNNPNIASDRGWTSIGFRRKDTLGDFENRDDLGPMHGYLQLLARHQIQTNIQSLSKTLADRSQMMLSGIGGSVKQAQSVMFPREDSKGIHEYLPEWYSALRDSVNAQNSVVSESAAIRSVSTLGHVYGLSIMGPAGGNTMNMVGAADAGEDPDSVIELQSSTSRLIEATLRGQWGSEAMMDPELCDTTLLIMKLKALGVPPLPPNMGKPTVAANLPNASVAPVKMQHSDPRPRMTTLVATTSRNQGHDGPVVRLAVAPDNSFFVSASHDGTCRVWETPHIDECAGLFDSSLIYSGHNESVQVRVNDIALIEGSYSAVSGDSNGSVHVWRTDLASGAKAQSDDRHDRTKITGTSTVRTLHQDEGEILAVSHFNTLSASVVTYASQLGSIHSWDLRSNGEPFLLKHGPELGHLSSVVLGSDRNWIVAGTSRGYVACWDIRFQKAVKLWRHSRRATISRLGTSMTTPPQSWGTSKIQRDLRPSVFVAAGENECSMFDAISGFCNECFRVVSGDTAGVIGHVEPMPTLTDVSISSRRHGYLTPHGFETDRVAKAHLPSLNSINALVGSIGSSGRHSYLITGGGDSLIRYWDFAIPSKCYVVNGQGRASQRSPSFERIDYNSEQRLMICREPASSEDPSSTFSGLRTVQSLHADAVQDLKVIESSSGSYLVCGGRDGAIRVYY